MRRSSIFPVDLAPAVLESVNPRFSSSTTLAGGADFYVANRGNGTIVRMRQGGTVLAMRSHYGSRRLGVLGPGRLNGIATAPDATRIWVSISGEVPASERRRGRRSWNCPHSVPTKQPGARGEERRGARARCSNRRGRRPADGSGPGVQWTFVRRLSLAHRSRAAWGRMGSPPYYVSGSSTAMAMTPCSVAAALLRACTRYPSWASPVPSCQAFRRAPI